MFRQLTNYKLVDGERVQNSMSLSLPRRAYARGSRTVERTKRANSSEFYRVSNENTPSPLRVRGSNLAEKERIELRDLRWQISISFEMFVLERNSSERWKRFCTPRAASHRIEKRRARWRGCGWVISRGKT